MTVKSTGATVKPLITKVQTLRRQVPALVDEETWRDFLAANADGERSTRAMSVKQLEAIVEALHRAGAPRLAPKLGKPRHAGSQMDKARALWITLAKAGVVTDSSETALAAFIRRQTGQEIGVLSPAAGRAVIEALKAWARRKNVAIE